MTIGQLSALGAVSTGLGVLFLSSGMGFKLTDFLVFLIFIILVYNQIRNYLMAKLMVKMQELTMKQSEEVKDDQANP